MTQVGTHYEQGRRTVRYLRKNMPPGELAKVLDHWKRLAGRDMKSSHRAHREFALGILRELREL